jgi:coenzyme F420-reducing hydrogenase gamma subunit
MSALDVIDPPRATGQSQTRPRLGVFKFSSCDGCQLSLLDCEDELLAVAGRVEIGYFLEAARVPLEGEFDVALVEGSISTPEQEHEIRKIRERTKLLICIGACASHGGIQGLRNFGAMRADDARAIVYALPQYVETLEHSRPASDYVAVDLELPGCPINKQQLLGVLAQLLAGGRPRLDSQALCLECKRRGLVCVLVAQGMPCMGPVTRSGCGVLCPGYDRPCYSCFGPAAQPNTASLAARFAQLGLEPAAIRRLFHAFYANDTHYFKEGQRHGEPTAG